MKVRECETDMRAVQVMAPWVVRVICTNPDGVMRQGLAWRGSGRTPEGEEVEVGLTYVFGIGRLTKKILWRRVLTRTRRCKIWRRARSVIRSHIDQNVEVEGDLRREVSRNYQVGG